MSKVLLVKRKGRELMLNLKRILACEYESFGGNSTLYIRMNIQGLSYEFSGKEAETLFDELMHLYKDFDQMMTVDFTQPEGGDEIVR